MAHESWSFLLIIIILIMLLGERNYGKYPETNFDFIIHSNFIVQANCMNRYSRYQDFLLSVRFSIKVGGVTLVPTSFWCRDSMVWGISNLIYQSNPAAITRK
jgi:hypothetical protein